MIKKMLKKSSILFFIFTFICGLLITDSYAVAIDLDNGKTFECQVELPNEYFICIKGDEIVFMKFGNFNAYGGNLTRQGIEYYNIKEMRTDKGNSVVRTAYNAPIEARDKLDLNSIYSLLKHTESYINREDLKNNANMALAREKVRAFTSHNYPMIKNSLHASQVKVGNITCHRFPSYNKMICEFFECNDGSFLRMGSDLEKRLSPDIYKISPDGLWTVKESIPEIRDLAGHLLARKIGAHTSIYSTRYLPQDMATPDSMAVAMERNSIYWSDIDKNFVGCKKEGELEKIYNSYEDYIKRIAEQDLVHYIAELSNGALIGDYLNIDKLNKIACLNGDTYYNPEAFERSQSLAPAAERQGAISLLAAKELFTLAQGMNNIAWNYKQDGCYARAHLMARRFEELGYKVDKAWMGGDLKVQDEDGNETEWNYHVAPVVYVKGHDGVVGPYVIDPSIMEEPVPLREWSDRMTAHLRSPGYYETRFPFPANTAITGRAVLAISNNIPYGPVDRERLTESEKTRQAEKTMRDYKEY